MQNLGETEIDWSWAGKWSQGQCPGKEAREWLERAPGAVQVGRVGAGVGVRWSRAQRRGQVRHRTGKRERAWQGKVGPEGLS